MSIPLRVLLQAIMVIPDRQIARHGGTPGLHLDPFEGARAMEGLAVGAISEAEFSHWLRGVMAPLRG